MKARLAFASLLIAFFIAGACSDAFYEMLEEGLQAKEDTEASENDICEMCSFNDNNEYYCRKVPCEGGCLFDGAYYAVGNKFEAKDHCNTCICKDFGEVVCTNNDCHS